VLVDTFTLNDLKLAFINEDIKKLEELSKKKPLFNSMEEAIEIQNLLKEINSFLLEKKHQLLKDMQKMKQIKKYTS